MGTHVQDPDVVWTAFTPSISNLCSWALRCLLIEDGNRLNLLDNGNADKQHAN